MYLRVITFFIGFIALAACSRHAIDSVRYVPINNPEGRLCVSQCKESKAFCESGCNLTRRTCVSEMQAQAIKDYEQYAHEQLVTRQVLDLRPRDFERFDRCDPKSCNGDCEHEYQSCYELCGGVVEKSSTCTFMCF
ncbi:MAG: hypothetical protein PHX43_02020 [Alphaproteobacteria bacterium]|nr:hypothetical protein [Alphaproteobacteria bacterium]